MCYPKVKFTGNSIIISKLCASIENLKVEYNFKCELPPKQHMSKVLTVDVVITRLIKVTFLYEDFLQN